MYCSTYQAIRVYEDLIDAMNGEASHGNDTEIYAYRLMPNMPRMMNEHFKFDMTDIIHATNSLIEIIDIFCEKYQDAYFLIDGLECHSWRDKYRHKFDHRVKVQYQYNGKK